MICCLSPTVLQPTIFGNLVQEDWVNHNSKVRAVKKIEYLLFYLY